LQVLLAEYAGFCRGVKNALELTLREVSQGKKVYTLGPLVHNKQVIQYLAAKGVQLVTSVQELLNENDSEITVIMRAHGVSPVLYRNLQADQRITIIDATCPFVKRLQKIAHRYGQEGYHIIIYGNRCHPEVQALLGWAGENATVIDPQHNNIPAEMPLSSKTILISQTTQREDRFWSLAAKLKVIDPELEVRNTICRATMLRQGAAAKLAATVDLMFVVGDPQSANTHKLTQVCRETVKTYQIAEAREIPGGSLAGVERVGVTAGASTPPWTIKEVMVKMENGKLDNLEDTRTEDAGTEETNTEDTSTEETIAEEGFSFQEIRDYRPGDTVKGKVVLVEEEQVLVDIGYKSEAILPRNEIILEEEPSLKDKFAVGDEIDLLVLRVNQQEDKIIVSQKRLERERRWKEIEEAAETGTTMQGIVKEVVPAGIIVDLDSGIEAFMPGSLVDVRYIPDFTQFMGQEFSFKVIELNRERDKIILSRKLLLEEEAEKQKKEVLANLKEDEVITGIVKRLTDFGAFVDVGGIDGLVHISEVSWQRVGHPQEVLKVGEEVNVKVLEVIPERERISLSIRRTQLDPWTRINKEFSVGEIITGRVTRIVNFGAFVELIPGAEGLVHISQMADFHVNHPSEIIREGEDVEAKILDINVDNKRISLSMKKARPASRNFLQSSSQESESQNVALGDVFGDLFNSSRSAQEEDENEDE
jgi:small subunit ribosomal protein S1